MNTKLRCLLAAVIAFSLVLPGLASAEKYGHRHYKHGYKHNYGHNYGHKKHHRHGNRHYGGHGYYNKHVTHYYKHDNSNEKLLIGLVVGGILGYAINNAQHRSAYHYGGGYPPAQINAYPKSSYQPAIASCLQQREYQTTVVVGGKNVPAYGTACLQPDGSWLHQSAKPVSY